MIKKIPVDALIPGMYVSDLNCGWMDHPFLTNAFLVDDEARVAKIRDMGIHEVYIDTGRGLDLPDAPTREEVESSLQARMEAIATAAPKPLARVNLAEEAPRARRLHTEANRIVKNLLTDIRLGAQIELDKVEPMVEAMVDSVFSNPNALLPLAGLKQHDNYTFEHSVSVCALMVAFSRGLALSRELIREIALGALLHDVGKARVPEAILNKPARLTEAEFAKMKNHVVQSIVLLQHTPGVSETALMVAGQHHERHDGTGYPNQLKGEGISLYGQMAAIVDVYDAISSDRVYHKGLAPSDALKKLLEWSEHHFEPKLVHSFIRAIGIYPSGSLVRLASGRLAVVREQNERDLLHPVVQVIFHIGSQCYLPPETIDLARSQDRVVAHEDFAKWKIDPKPWLPA